MRGRGEALADGVWRLPAAPGQLLNSFVLRGPDGAATLLDAGLRRSPPRLLAGLAAVGVDPAAVTAIVLTHAHLDHAGGLARLRQRTGARVVVHERDAIHVRTGRPPAYQRGGWVTRLADRLPAGFPAAAVDEEVRDGQVLALAGGLRVVHTPGHTPGHICLLHVPTGVLFVGDALYHVRRLQHPLAAACTSAALARASVARLCELDFEIAAFGHGPALTRGAREAIRALCKNDIG